MVPVALLAATILLAQATPGVLPASAAAPARPPAGAVAAGDTKTACIYVDPGAGLRQAERATGLTYRCLEVFVTGSSTWSAWANPWITHPQYGYRAWLTASPGPRTLVIATNLVPNDAVRQPGWRARCAAGEDARYARQLARNLVSAGYGGSVIRLGPEMNGEWEVDWIGPTVATERSWAGCFARIVAAMRSVPGARFLFDWNVNAGYQPIPLLRYYPGDAYVDIVGIDAYDEAPHPLPPVGSPDRWSVLVSERLGLLEVAAFATAHHKPLSIPEWGTMSTNGDDGAYVTAMARFVATHVVAYQAWYDADNNHVYPLQANVAPRSFAAYVAAFGPRQGAQHEQQGSG